MNALILTILVPILGSFGVAISPKRLQQGIATSILGLTFLSAISILPWTIRGQQIFFSRYFTDWFSLSLIADGLSVFMAIVSSFVGLLIAFYSIDYMRHYEDKPRFFFWMVLFIGAMMGLVFSANLILLFCFWELTSVCSWRLIGFYRQEKDTKAADKAFLVTVFGASLMLVGFVLIYLKFGSMELNALKGISLTNLVAFLILGGIVSKSAQLPLQSWLVDAGVAPTPVTALLHAAVLVKIGIYVFARLFNLTFVTEPVFLQVSVVLSLATIIIAAGCALVENNMKRILAYSTISQLGYILLIFAFNSPFSFKIGLIYILAHSLAKAGLFLCAGIIEHKTGTKDIKQLGGLASYMPYTKVAYLLCAFSIIGIPPFLGFWPKFMLVLLALKSGQILVGILAIVGALFTLFYLMRLFNAVFLGETKIAVKEDRSSFMVWVVCILGIISLLLGVIFKLPFSFVENIVR